MQRLTRLADRRRALSGKRTGQRHALVAAVVASGALASGANGQYYDDPSPSPDGGDAQPDASVNANGNALVPDSLNFDPAEVSVNVGGLVRWTNTDAAVPHTATENHGLWRLTGKYGSPGPYQGFGPGESVERRFEAGTHHYYCEVHPDAMKAVVRVPVALERRPGRRVKAMWSAAAPTDGLVFDVQVRRKGRRWNPLRVSTPKTHASFPLRRRGTRWQVRARLRDAKDPAKATDWSPTAKIRS